MYKEIKPMKRILLILIGILLNLNFGFAQIKGLSSFDLESMMKGDALEQLNSDQMTTAMALPFGNVVEEQNYLVGPGDIFLIQNLGAMSQKDIAFVSPESKIILTRVGEVDLKGKTLSEAKLLIITKIQENSKDALVYVSLYRPRNVIVEVSGNVGNPGTYTYPASYKISTVIKFANQLKPSGMTTLQQGIMLHQKIEKKKQFDELFSNSGIPYITSYQTRNILVMHNNGTTDIADLDKAAVLSDAKFDPYIREGDRIFIPYDNMDAASISISGTVIRPFITAFKNGDMASLLLKFGGGLREDADLENVKLFLSSDNSSVNLKIDEQLNLLQEDIELQPGSFIIVGKKNETQKNNSGVVSVVGNVNKPGVYPVINDKTTIKEVIDMSGGFTEEAYLPLATIVRRDESLTNSKNIDYQLMEKFQHSNLTIYDTSRYKIDIIMREPRVACDFEAVFNNNDNNANISLRDGDIIKIPSNPRSVFVFGQVRNPGYIKFEEGKNMKWYIEKAGGFSETSKKSGARIIRGKNKTWVEGEDDVYVFAGDEIYIPAPSSVPAEAEAQTWIMISSLASSVFALLNLVYWWTRP